jgi:GTP-binding protein HflX
VPKKQLPAIVLDVCPKTGAEILEHEQKLQELLQLTKTAGGILIKKIIQKRGRPSAKTFLGTGKIEEAAEFAKENNIKLVIINGILRPNHYRNLNDKFPKMQVWDKIDLILSIFEQHANTNEARLQIKLARLHHEIPKIYAYQATTLFERAGAGIGTRGAGERGIEAEKRHIRRQIKSTEEKIKTLEKRQQLHLQQRQRQGKKTVALVGYTNAGKSSLLSALTGKKVYIADELFATLENRTGQLWLPEIQETVLLSDTIGFLQDLPPQLLKSFHATLQQVIQADLLLHVIDVSDPNILQKIAVTQDVLTELNCHQIPQILVGNKTDAHPHWSLIEERQASFRPWQEHRHLPIINVSATAEQGFEELQTLITQQVT